MYLPSQLLADASIEAVHQITLSVKTLRLHVVSSKPQTILSQRLHAIVCLASECSKSAENCYLQQDRNFSFQPGQWIDFHALGVPIIGGYSIVSPPSQLTSMRTFDIAVKQSSHPPAHWVHTQVLVWLQPQMRTIVIALQALQRQGTEAMTFSRRQYRECR